MTVQHIFFTILNRYSIRSRSVCRYRSGAIRRCNSSHMLFLFLLKKNGALFGQPARDFYYYFVQSTRARPGIGERGPDSARPRLSAAGQPKPPRGSAAPALPVRPCGLTASWLSGRRPKSCKTSE